LQPGHILFHRDFVFHDGAQKDKYLVVLAAHQSNIVVAKTTSKGHHYRNDFGCQSANRFPAFYLPRGSCCFRTDTWICFEEFYEFKAQELTQRIVSTIVNQYGLLGNELTRDIQFCAMGCDDISAYQEKMVKDSLVPV